MQLQLLLLNLVFILHYRVNLKLNWRNKVKSLIKMNVFLVIVVTLLSASWANAAGIGNNIVVQLAGPGTAYGGDEKFEQYGLDPLGAFCFDMDLIDAKTGNVISSGSDCLSGITPSITDNWRGVGEAKAFPLICAPHHRNRTPMPSE